MEVSNRVVTIADSQQCGYCGFNLIYYIIKCCAYYTKKGKHRFAWRLPSLGPKQLLCDFYPALIFVLLILLQLRHFDGKYTIFNLRCNFVFINILRQYVSLLIV